MERSAAATPAVAGVPVAVVNPLQVRDFAEATGRLAKTDRIDAGVLARFAEAVRSEPRPLADEHARELSAALLVSIPGVWDPRSLRPCWRSFPSSSTSTTNGSPRWPTWRPPTGTRDP